MNFFVAPPSMVLSWLNRKGYYGSLYDAFHDYVLDGAGSDYGTIYDNFLERMKQSGYDVTGYSDLDDMLTTMFMEKTGEIYRYDAERRFFMDDTLDMFSTTGGFFIRDDDGNLVKDDDGNIVRDDS